MSTMTVADEIMLAAPGEPIVNITAYTARQKASGYVGSYISHLMGGGEPSLVLSHNRLVWRVPLFLTSPQQGTLGTVGSLDVDARTSQLIVPPDLAEQVKAHAPIFLQTSPDTIAIMSGLVYKLLPGTFHFPGNSKFPGKFCSLHTLRFRF